MNQSEVAGGNQFIVSFTPVEYGKTIVGKLIIETDEMQWSYEVRGVPPSYMAPVTQARVDDRPGDAARAQVALKKQKPKNFMAINMQKQLGR